MNKQILRLAVPFIISNITVPLVGTVDTALMGHFGSQAHLGAIGLAGSIFNFLYWNFAFLRMSMAGFTAQAYGAKDKQELSILLGRSFLLALAGGLLLIALKDPIARLAFFLAGGGPEIEQIAAQYYAVRIFAAPATIGMYAIIGWLIGMQNARAPMWISLAINTVNIGISALLVIRFGMTATGVAWGTLIAQYTGLVLSLVTLWVRYPEALKGIRFSQLFRGGSVADFFRVNRDVFVRTLIVITVLTFFNFASANQGQVILGINVIFLQLIYAFSFFIDGFANAAEALVGRYIGERDRLSFRSAVAHLFRWGAILGVLFTTGYFLAFKPILGIYTTDPEILSRASDFAGWIMFLPLISFTAFVWDGIYLGATAAREQRNATLIAALLFLVLFYSLRNIIGNHALLLAQLTFFAVRGIIQTIYYKTAILGRFFTGKEK